MGSAAASAVGIGGMVKGLFDPGDRGVIGRFLQPLDEAIGEVTGRNVMREQMNLAEQRLLEENAAREKMIRDEQQANANQDMAASRAAGARGRGTGMGRGSLQMAGLGDEGDFLGL